MWLSLKHTWGRNLLGEACLELEVIINLSSSVHTNAKWNLSTSQSFFIHRPGRLLRSQWAASAHPAPRDGDTCGHAHRNNSQEPVPKPIHGRMGKVHHVHTSELPSTEHGWIIAPLFKMGSRPRWDAEPKRELLAYLWSVKRHTRRQYAV